MIKEIFYTTENVPSFLLHKPQFVMKIKKQVGDLVYKGDILFSINWMVEDGLRAPFNGRLISLNVKSKQNLIKNMVVCQIEEMDDKVFKELALSHQKSKLDNIEIAIITDDFTKEKSIIFLTVAGEETKYFKIVTPDSIHGHSYFGITFENFNGFIYIKFISRLTGMTLAKGDSIIILFEDESTLTYVFSGKSSGDKNESTNIYPLEAEHLKKFASVNFVKMKITNNRKNEYCIATLMSQNFNSQFHSDIEGQYLLKRMVMEFIKVHIENKIDSTLQLSL